MLFHLCIKTYRCIEIAIVRFKFDSEDPNERVLKQTIEGKLEKYHRVFDEKAIITSTIRGFLATKFLLHTQIVKEASFVTAL